MLAFCQAAAHQLWPPFCRLQNSRSIRKQVKNKKTRVTPARHITTSKDYLLNLISYTTTVTQIFHLYHPFIMAGNPETRFEDLFAKERARAREDFERQKEKLISETEKSRPSTARFIGQNDSMEDSLKKSTVGLVRLEDFQKRRKALEEEKARIAAKTDDLKYVSHRCNPQLVCSGGLQNVEVRLGMNKRRRRNGSEYQRRHYHSP